MAKNKVKNDGVVIDENGVERVTGIEKKYNDQTHVLGRIWGVAAIVVFMLIPLSMSLYLHTWPQWSAFGGAAIIIAGCAVGAIGENIMYTTLIGPTATYVSFLTGNISNLKFPCTVAAVESADVDIHSDEGEVLATVAVCVSSIVTTLTIMVFCVALAPFIPKMTDPESVLYPAFKQVLPALFGAIMVPYCVKNPKLWEFPCLCMVLAYWFIPSMTASYAIFVGVITAIIGALVMHKLGWLDEKEAATEKVAVDVATLQEEQKEDFEDEI